MPPVRLTAPPPPTIAPPPASDTAATVAEESTPASAPTTAKGKGPQGKIALLFLIYEEIHQPELWRAFLESADRLSSKDGGERLYSIYIHAKSRTIPLPPFLEKHHLPTNAIVPTEYADISLVHAMNTLLRHALTDTCNTKFVFLSGHCIPIKPFAHVHSVLTSTDHCHFSAMDIDQNDRELKRALLLAASAGAAGSLLPPGCAAKASQWCVLNRRIATRCVEVPPHYVRAFENTRAPEEWYYLSTALISPLHDDNDENSAVEQPSQVLSPTRRTPVPPDVRIHTSLTGNHTGPTFANWRETEYTPGGHRPRTYKTVTVDELHGLVTGPCLFARKFATGCEGLEQLRELLMS